MIVGLPKQSSQPSTANTFFIIFSATLADSEHLCVPRPMAGLGSAEVGKQKQTWAVVRRRFASIIYQWTLPGKTPSKSQQHGCNFPTSTATPTITHTYLGVPLESLAEWKKTRKAKLCSSPRVFRDCGSMIFYSQAEQAGGQLHPLVIDKALGEIGI